jgi:hypothetical protein
VDSGWHNFFLPVKVLSLVFCGKFLQALERAFQEHKLTLAGELSPLQSPAAFVALLRAAAPRNWVVYAKRPFAGPRKCWPISLAILIASPLLTPAWFPWQTVRLLFVGGTTLTGSRLAP